MKTILIKTILPLLILGLAAGSSYWLYSNKPQTKKRKPQRPVPVVKTMAMEKGHEPIVFEASGTVIPARKVTILSEVEGRIIKQNPELVPGGIIPRDALLIQIDPLDYQLRVQDRQADIATAQYKLDVEQGKQIIAHQEWRILEKELRGNQVSKDLALRKPHLRQAEAQLAAAESGLAAARLAEQRTVVNSPFNGLVLDEKAEIGQFIGRQTPIATLVATDEFWVQVSIPLSLLGRIRFPEPPGEKGSKVQIILENGTNGKAQIHEANVFKLLGDLEPVGRMARILVAVQDPLGLSVHGTASGPQEPQGPKILLGSFVKVRINAGTLENMYVIPRRGLREGDRIWTVNSEGIVNFRAVDVLWRRTEEVLVDTDLPVDEKIILSRLQSPIPGMQVRDESRLGQGGRKQKDEAEK
ncbi:MAG: efflux RND transporter periplasmic adaptor subunit [Thermodesulfobacteriota bacterium]